MSWRQLQICRRAVHSLPKSSPSSFPFEMPSFSSLSAQNMEYSRGVGRKLLDTRTETFLYPHHRRMWCAISSRPSYLLFGTLQGTPFLSKRSCKTFCDGMERGNCNVVNHNGLPSSIPAGDIGNTSNPTMLHCASFLPMFQGQKAGQERPYVLLILNHDLPVLTLFLWNKASLRICADGGANQIYDSLPNLFPNENPATVRERYKPDIIKGDLDSIRPEVKEFYSTLGTEILCDADDQDSTDFQKCVKHVMGNIHEVGNGHMKLLVLGGLSGRLDHVFANVNTLYLFPKVQMVLLNDENMAFLLPRGYKHEIRIDSSLEGPHCGLIPLGEPSSCTTTTGLKWNLTNSSMKFGGLISTSNRPMADHITVQSDTDLIWTVTLHSLQSRLKEQMSSADWTPI